MVNSYEEIDKLMLNSRRMYLNKNLYLLRDKWEDTFVSLRHRDHGDILVYHPDRIVILKTIDPNHTTLRKIFVNNIPDVCKVRNFDGALMLYHEDHKHLRIPVAAGMELSWHGLCRNRLDLQPLYIKIRRIASARLIYRVLMEKDAHLKTDKEPCLICGGRTVDEIPLMEHMGLKYHMHEHLEGLCYVPEMLLEALYFYCGSHRAWDRETYTAARAVVTYRGDISSAHEDIKRLLADAWAHYIANLLGEDLRE